MRNGTGSELKRAYYDFLKIARKAEECLELRQKAFIAHKIPQTAVVHVMSADNEALRALVEQASLIFTGVSSKASDFQVGTGFEFRADNLVTAGLWPHEAYPFVFCYSQLVLSFRELHALICTLALPRAAL